MATFHDRTTAPIAKLTLLRGGRAPCRVLTDAETIAAIEADIGSANRCSLPPVLSTVADFTLGQIAHCEHFAAQARTLHSRRALARAADHGVALLAALNLPQIVRHDIVTLDPAAIGDALDVVIAHLDALDAPGEDLEETGDDEDDATAEDSLGAPENHPGRWHIDMSGHYHVGRRCHPLGSQVTWGAGLPDDVEDDGDDRESEAGYDLACDEDEREDDGLIEGEHDTAELEPWLGSLEHVDQTRWAKSSLNDAEHDATDNVSHYMSPTDWEAVYANRPALNALTARAQALCARHAPRRDPDTLTPIGPGVMWWEGPGHGNVTPVPMQAWGIVGPNLVELVV